MKRFTYYTCCIVVGFCLPTFVGAAFLDTAFHPHKEEIEILASKNIVQGYGYGIFRPDILLNRAEFLKIVLVARYGTQVPTTTERQCFKDFVKTEQWFWQFACAGKQLGIVSGYSDGTFGGSRTITFAEALKMVAATYTIPVVPAEDIWYVPYFSLAQERGLFSYFPRDATYTLTRSDMAYLLVHIGVLSTTSSASSIRSLPTYYNYFGTPTCGNWQIERSEQCDDGNTQANDGCSSTCQVEVAHSYSTMSIVPVPPNSAQSSVFSSAATSASSVASSTALVPKTTLMVTPMPRTSSSAYLAIGQQSTAIYSFTLRASVNAVQVTSVPFLLNRNVGTYTLYNVSQKTSAPLTAGTNALQVVSTTPFTIPANQAYEFHVYLTPVTTERSGTEVKIQLQPQDMKALDTQTNTVLLYSPTSTEYGVLLSTPLSSIPDWLRTYTLVSTNIVQVANAVLPNGTLQKGIIPIATMNVTAASGTTAADLRTMQFTMTSSNVSLFGSGFTLRAVNVASSKFPCVRQVTVGQVVCTVPAELYKNYSIKPGVTMQFVLDAIVLNNRVRIAEPVLLQATLNANTNAIQWHDGTKTYWWQPERLLQFTRYQ